jgi:hypothetical protein
MKATNLFGFENRAFGLILLLGLPWTTSAQGQETQYEVQGVEVLTRGPVHEAFAGMVTFNPEPGIVVTQAPPQYIEELPPEQRPSGDNVTWIPGYWAWDDDTEQFIWISGVWREIPPGQRFVPGYWEEAGTGYRWVSGFWTSAQAESIAYLPPPPESLDLGPSSGSPGEEYFYTPGVWLYQGSTYRWRPGYWQPHVVNWVWIPARYVWTPSGYVFCAGFWDRLFEARGVAFAPVCFARPIYRQPLYVYRPICRIITDVNFYVHLFVRPSYGHYYFGDWYGDRYAQRDYCAWVDYPRRYRGYDPLYNYYGSARSNLHNTTMISWVESQHRHYHDRPSDRPRHVYHKNDADGHRVARNTSERADQRPTLVDDLERQVHNKDRVTHSQRNPDEVRFQKLSEEDRKNMQRSIDPLRRLQATRREVETKGRKADSSARQSISRGSPTGRQTGERPDVRLKPADANPVKSFNEQRGSNSHRPVSGFEQMERRGNDSQPVRRPDANRSAGKPRPNGSIPGQAKSDDIGQRTRQSNALQSTRTAERRAAESIDRTKPIPSKTPSEAIRRSQPLSADRSARSQGADSNRVATQRVESSQRTRAGDTSPGRRQAGADAAAKGINPGTSNPPARRSEPSQRSARPQTEAKR